MPPGGGTPGGSPSGTPGGVTPSARPGSGGGWTGTPGSPGARTPHTPDSSTGRPGPDRSVPSQRRPGDTDPNARGPQRPSGPDTRGPQRPGDPNSSNPQRAGDPAANNPQRPGTTDPQAAGPQRPGDTTRSPQQAGDANGPGPRRPGDAPEPVARGSQGTATQPGTQRPGTHPGGGNGPGNTRPGHSGPEGPHRTPDGGTPRRDTTGTPHRDAATTPRHDASGAPHRDTPDHDSPHHDTPRQDNPQHDNPPADHHNDPSHDTPNHDNPNQDTPAHHNDPLTPDEVNQHHSESTPAGSSYHRGDADMGDLPHRVQPDPDGRFTADVHVTPDGHARIGDRLYTPEEFADVLRRNADYDGRPIRLIGCDAGSNDFAHRLSRELDTEVMAPSKPAWTDSNGRVFSSDYEIGPDGRMRPRIPPDGEWSVHRPDGTSHHVGDDGFAPETRHGDQPHSDPHEVDADSSRHRGDGTDGADSADRADGSDEPSVDADHDSADTQQHQPQQQQHHSGDDTHNEPSPEADPDDRPVPKDNNPDSRQQEAELLDPVRQAEVRQHPQDVTDFAPSSHGSPTDVGGPNPHPDSPTPPRAGERFPGDQKLEANHEYRVHDADGNPRGSYHTDEHGRVTHIDTSHPNEPPRVRNAPNPGYHPNPDVTHPHPDTTYRVEIDGHHQTFTTDADGVPHPSAEYHRPDFEGDPVTIGHDHPHAPKAGDSFQSGGPYEPHREYDVTDAAGVHRGTFHTDADGNVRWASVESGRVGRTNPDLPEPGSSHLPPDVKVHAQQKINPDGKAPPNVDHPERFKDAQRHDVKRPTNKPFLDDTVPRHPEGHPYAGEPKLEPNSKYVVSSDFKDGGKTTTHPRTMVWTDENGRIAAIETYRPHHPDLINPGPNMVYDVDHGRFTYQTGVTEHGGVDTVQGRADDLTRADESELSRRDGPSQDKSNSLATTGKYDGGHIAGNQFTGPGELVNMMTQWRPQNQGWKGQAGTEAHWKAFETDLANHLKAGGKIQGMDVFPLRNPGERVPHTIQVRWVETDQAGNITGVHMRSFGNGPAGQS